jgi:hypothetical protein
LFSTAKKVDQQLLNGVYPPIPTLFNDDGSVATDKLTNNLKKLLAETDSFPEFKGLVVLGSNGGNTDNSEINMLTRISHTFPSGKENSSSGSKKDS